MKYQVRIQKHWIEEDGVREEYIFSAPDLSSAISLAWHFQLEQYTVFSVIEKS